MELLLEVDEPLDALVDVVDDRDQEGETDDLEDLAMPSCTCDHGPAAHQEDGCAAPCRCTAPGLRGLLYDAQDDEDLDELAVKLAKSLAAARGRARTPEIERGREKLKEFLGRRRKPKPKNQSHREDISPCPGADVLEAIEAQACI